MSDSDIKERINMNEFCKINNWDLNNYDCKKYIFENKQYSNKIVQSLWIGPCLSLMERSCIKSFLDKGHEFHLYVYGETKNIPEGCKILDGNEILPESEIFYYKKNSTNCGKSEGSVSAFSNLFRYKLLFEKGGYWVDMDMVCLKYFDFKDEYIFSSEETKYVWNKTSWTINKKKMNK